jgi:hypothetical protein
VPEFTKQCAMNNLRSYVNSVQLARRILPRQKAPIEN